MQDAQIPAPGDRAVLSLPMVGGQTLPTIVVKAQFLFASRCILPSQVRVSLVSVELKTPWPLFWSSPCLACKILLSRRVFLGLHRRLTQYTEEVLRRANRIPI